MAIDRSGYFGGLKLKIKLFPEIVSTYSEAVEFMTIKIVCMEYYWQFVRGSLSLCATLSHNLLCSSHADKQFVIAKGKTKDNVFIN